MASSGVVQEGNFVQQMEMVDKNLSEIKEKLMHLHSKEVCFYFLQNDCFSMKQKYKTRYLG